MKVLVTGGAGFVGTNLVKRLLKDGHEVISIDNYITGLESNHQSQATYLTLDTNNISELPNQQIDIMFHLAALSRIQPSFQNPSLTFRNNLYGTFSVLEWARKHNIKLIYAGSSSRWHNPYRSPYALSKHLGEEACKLYRQAYKLDIEITRFYNVYGPHEIIDGDWAAVIGKWRGKVSRGEPLPIVGDGEQRRDFTHIDDIVDGLVKVAFSGQHHEDAWELGTGHNYSINEIYEMFASKFNTTSVYVPDQSGNYRETRRENDDALDRLGWKPSDRLREYINSL